MFKASCITMLSATVLVSLITYTSTAISLAYNYCDNSVGTNQDKKYYCTKCIVQTDAMQRNYGACAKCKYTVTERTGTCKSHASSLDFKMNKSSVNDIPGCEAGNEVSKNDLSGCYMCSEGYALVTDAKNPNAKTTCKLSTIKKCVVSVVTGIIEKCFVCRQGLPNSQFTACDDKANSLKDLDPNCAFGMRHSAVNNSNPFCALCEPGYALVPNTNGKLVCNKTFVNMDTSNTSTQCPNGCARCNIAGVCAWCDHYRGYYMTSINQCTFDAKLTTLTWGLILLFLIVNLLS